MTPPAQRPGPVLPTRFGDFAIQGFLAEQADGLGWWQTCIASAFIDLCRVDGFVVAFAGIAKVLRTDVDPQWAVGGTEVQDAIGATLEWLAERINPHDVEHWLLAGCWKPRTAQAFAATGLRPQHLLDAAGQPAHWVEVADGQHVPLAVAVIEWDLPLAHALQIVANRHIVEPPPQPGGQP